MDRSFTRSVQVLGMASVVLIPVVHLHGLTRFVLLPQVLIFQVVCLTGIGIWIFKGQAAWKASPLVFPALVFLLTDVLSVFQSVNPVASLLPVVTHVAGFLFFILLLNGLDRAGFETVVRTACVVAVAISAFGLMQFVGIGTRWVPSGGLPSSTLGHRNLAAAYLVGFLPLTLWVWMGKKRPFAIGLWGVGVGLEGAFLLATRSRGAWIGLGCALLTFLVLGLYRRFYVHWTRSHRITLIAACVLGLGISILPAEMEDKVGAAMWGGKQGVMTAVFSVFESGGDKGRLAMWQRTLEMISDWPIMGIGSGNWKFIYPVYSQGDMINVRVAPHRPHNDFLWIWSELGTVGLVAYLFLLWKLFQTGFRRLKTWNDPMLAGALLACLTGILVNSFFSFPMEFPATWLPFYLALAGLGLGASPRQYNVGLRLWAVVAVLVLGLGITFKQIQFGFHALPMRIAFARSAWEETLRQADAALAWGPFDEEAFLMRGQAHAGLGNLRQARRDYEQGLVYHPNSIGLWNGMGQVRQQMGDRTGAAQAFYRALDLDPKLGEIYNNIGTLHAQSGALDSAAVVYQRAIGLEVGLVDAYANLSTVYRKQDDLVRALDTAQMGLKLGPDHLEMLNASGNVLMSARRFQAAAKMFVRALQVDSTRVEIYYNLGRTYELSGDRTRAIRAYRTFLDRWSGGEVPFIDVAKQRLRVLAHPE